MAEGQAVGSLADGAREGEGLERKQSSPAFLSFCELIPNGAGHALSSMEIELMEAAG